MRATDLVDAPTLLDQPPSLRRRGAPHRRRPPPSPSWPCFCCCSAHLRRSPTTSRSWRQMPRFSWRSGRRWSSWRQLWDVTSGRADSLPDWPLMAGVIGGAAFIACWRDPAGNGLLQPVRWRRAGKRAGRCLGRMRPHRIEPGDQCRCWRNAVGRRLCIRTGMDRLGCHWRAFGATSAPLERSGCRRGPRLCLDQLDWPARGTVRLLRLFGLARGASDRSVSQVPGVPAQPRGRAETGPKRRRLIAAVDAWTTVLAPTSPPRAWGGLSATSRRDRKQFAAARVDCAGGFL